MSEIDPRYAVQDYLDDMRAIYRKRTENHYKLRWFYIGVFLMPFFIIVMEAVK